MASDAEDVCTRVVTMCFLIGSHAEFTDVGVHCAVGERELHVAAAAARAALLPFGQLKAGQVGNEIRLPLVAPRPDRSELALSAEIAILANAILKGVLI